MVMIAALVATSVGIMAGTVAWGWRNGTWRETVQERFDHEFHRIVERLHRHH